MRYWRNRHFVRYSRPTARTSGRTGCQPVQSSFVYNDRSEVLSAAIGTNLFTHAYDDIGNHLLFGDNATTNTFTHNQVNQMVGRGVLDAPPTTTFTYTPDGGLASDGTWTYAYGVEDQLVSVTSSSLTNGAIRVSNTYDYRRRRTSKTLQRLHVTSAPPPAPPSEEVWETVEKRTFVYNDWNLIHETISAIDGGTTNVTEVQYFWGLDLSDTLQSAGGVGGLLAVSHNGQFYFPAYDNNGNVTKYIDESGNIVAAYEYDDFGRTISQSGPLVDFFRHRFSTKYYDAETGLYYYGYRFYRPVLMRWLNRDPIEEGGGINLYSFCFNGGIQNLDVLGTTNIGRILDSFFSKSDTGPKLWIMGENDDYTAIVRKWSPVKSQVSIIKSLVAHAPRTWSTSHTTTPSWKPQMRFGFDPRSGYARLVPSPPGTTPITAAKAYMIYVFTTIRTDSLHTSSIGSFNIAATVDVVSFQPCRATINIWMYNEMSRRSFGQFANYWYFRNRSMRSQYMWWNWKERITFNSTGKYHDER